MKYHLDFICRLGPHFQPSLRKACIAKRTSHTVELNLLLRFEALTESFINFGFDPLPDAFSMEQMLAQGLSDCASFLELFVTDGTTFNFFFGLVLDLLQCCGDSPPNNILWQVVLPRDLFARSSILQLDFLVLLTAVPPTNIHEAHKCHHENDIREHAPVSLNRMVLGF